MWEKREVWEKARYVKKSLKTLGCMRCVRKSEMWEISERHDKKWDVRE